MLPTTISITPPQPDGMAAIGISVIAVIVAIAWVVLFSCGHSRRALILAVMAILVMAISAFAASVGVLSRFDHFPPPMLIMIAAVFVMAFTFGFSPYGRDGAAHLSLATLIGLQAFRFPLELVMHHAGTLGIMPVELSYSGYNFDIVTGIGALVLWFLPCYTTKRKRPTPYVKGD